MELRCCEVGRGVALRVAAALLLVAASVLLQGCAVFWGVTAATVAVGGTAMAVNPELEGLPREVTNRAFFSHPVADVYAALTQTVENNGRRIVEAIPATYTLRVSYPFSLLANNWGGVITITCKSEEAGTVLVIVGSGRDTTQRLTKIGVEIVDELRAALAQRPRPAPGGLASLWSAGTKGPPARGARHNAVGAAPRRARSRVDMQSEEVRVVVVDDSRDAAESLAELLRANGCAVHTAGSAPFALELIAHHRPHCVLFDIMMPEVSGDELCERLRAQYGDDIVLIAVSGHSDSDPRVGRAFAQADHYFTKPIDPVRLIELLRPHQ